MERRKKWETLRKEYASKFPKMEMTLPKDAASMSNYALDGCKEPQSTKAKKKHDEIRTSNGESSSNSVGYQTPTTGGSSSKRESLCSNNLLVRTRTTGGRSGSNTGRGRSKVDELTRKNRENTLDLLVAEAGLSCEKHQQSKASLASVFPKTVDG